jgi:hypothetical protein
MYQKEAKRKEIQITSSIAESVQEVSKGLRKKIT